jgi:hypothetical protein
MAQSYTPIWDDWLEVTQELNAQEKGRLIDAIVAYKLHGDWQEQIKGNERYVFPSYRVRLDRWSEVSDGRAKAGASGGKQTQANESKPKQTEANDSKSPKVKDKVKDKEEVIKENDLTVMKEKRQRFSPPTVDEVAEYCRERRNKVDPQRFVDFYAAKGWKIGQNPMKDWRAAVRTWEQRDNAPQQGKTVSAHAYTQRNYTEEDLMSIGDDLMAEAKAMRGAL